MKAPRSLFPLVATATVLSILELPSTPASAMDVALIWQAYIPEARGEICAYGDGACNRCLTDVRGEFGLFKDAGREERSYWFRDDRNGGAFEPYGIHASDVITGAASNGHVQSFARLPILSDSFTNWYAATHSEEDGRDGYLYFVEDDPSYQTPGSVRYVYPVSLTAHPGGVQAIGSFLVVPNEETAEDRSYYQVYDVSLPEQVRLTATRKLPATGAANVAVARLADGGYLFVSSRSSFHETYLAFYAHDIETLSGFKDLGLMTGAYWAENLTMITECETGDLYVLGGGGDRIGPAGGTGYYARENLWALYRVRRDEGKVNLDLVDYVEKDRSRGCNARASGTAFVDKDGHLHVYCHEKTLSAPGEGDSGDFADYWLHRPSSGGGVPGSPGGGGDTIIHEN